MTKRTMIFGLLLAAAFCVRAWFAAEFPVTLDEAWSDQVGGMSWSGVITEVKKDIHPPMTYAVHKIFTVSRTELGIRWFFALLSFLSVFYVLKLTGNSFPALLVLASSSFLILTGAIARMHALNLLFGAGACYHFVKTFEREKKSDFFMMAFFSLLMIYNFYPAGALICAFFAVYMIFRKRAVSRGAFYFFSLIGIMVLSMPLFLFFNPDSAGLYASKNLVDMPSGAIFAYLPYALAYSDNLIKFNEIRGVETAYFFVLVLPVIMLFWRAWIKRGNDLRFLLSVCLFLISLGIVFAVSLKVPKVLYDARYVSWLYALFAYMLIKGVDSFQGKAKFFLLSFIITVNLAAVYAGFKRNNENWKTVAHFIGGNSREKDAILFDAGHMKYPFGFYYPGAENLIALPEDVWAFKYEEVISYNRIWLILSHNWARGSAYKDMLGRKSVLSGEYKFGEIQVFLFENGAKK